MRNLKKILALVLALVMSLSLMATAGASSFPDVDAENPYATAIEVLDELKVFQGYKEDGTFRPTETLNRAQAAVLVYRIATGDVEDKYLDNYTYMQQSKFTDLDGYNWAKGYINYCQNAGIVVGTSSTTFDPGAKVTGYQLLVMLLRTLGYGKAGEFADPKGWELKTATIAESEGITKNVTSGDFGAPAPRQMVAEILFRGLLTETVEYSALTPDGYTKSGVTLGKRELGLEEIEGILVANEWANLDDGESVLAEGKTTLRTADKDYALDLGTKITDIGENFAAYIAKSRVLTIENTGNNVWEPENGKGTDISSSAKFEKETGMRKNGDTEYFINFEGQYANQSEWVIRYRVKIADLNPTGSAATYLTKLLADLAAGEDIVGSIRIEDGEYVRTFQPRTAIPQADIDIMQSIFYTADRQDENTTGSLNFVNGEVYAGTSSLKDLSDSKSEGGMSWAEFVDTYLKPIDISDINGSENGDWLKVIDNDGDGVADYVFYTWYWLDEVVSTYKNKAGDAVMQYYSFDDDDDRFEDKAPTIYMDGTDRIERDVEIGTVVLAAYIDDQYLVSKADNVTKTVEKYVFKTDEITTADGETYGQSFIGNSTPMQQNLTAMDEKTEYLMHLDHFGYVRAYELPGGTKYALVTELYYTNHQNGNLQQNWPMTVELTMPNEDGEAETNEYTLTNVKDNPFVALNYWTGISNRVITAAYENWLQPAIAHLGTTGIDRELPALDDELVPGLWTKNQQLVREFLAAGLNGSTEFNYGTALAPEISYTNVAVVNVDGDEASIRGAAQFGVDRDGRPTGRYAVDYIQLSTGDIDAKSVRYAIDANDANANNHYVNAVHDTEYYIAYNGGVYYVKDYANFPGLTNEKNNIRAAYAVARDTSSDNSDMPYWVADVIVYEVENWNDDAKSNISLVYYDHSRTTGQVYLLNTLNNKSEDPMIDVVPEDADNWLNGFVGWGFYDLYNTEIGEDGNMSARRINAITENFSDSGIYAGVITREVYIANGGAYIDVNLYGRFHDINGDGIKDANESWVTDASIKLNSNIYSITSDALPTSGNFYNEAEPLQYSETSWSEVQKGDRVMWVGSAKGTAVSDAAFIVDLSHGEDPSSRYDNDIYWNTAEFLGYHGTPNAANNWNPDPIGSGLNIGASATPRGALWRLIWNEQVASTTAVWNITYEVVDEDGNDVTLDPTDSITPVDRLKSQSKDRVEVEADIDGYDVTSMTVTTLNDKGDGKAADCYMEGDGKWYLNNITKDITVEIVVTPTVDKYTVTLKGTAGTTNVEQEYVISANGLKTIDLTAAPFAVQGYVISAVADDGTTPTGATLTTTPVSPNSTTPATQVAVDRPTADGVINLTYVAGTYSLEAENGTTGKNASDALTGVAAINYTITPNDGTADATGTITLDSAITADAKYADAEYKITFAGNPLYTYTATVTNGTANVSRNGDNWTIAGKITGTTVVKIAEVKGEVANIAVVNGGATVAFTAPTGLTPTGGDVLGDATVTFTVTPAANTKIDSVSYQISGTPAEEITDVEVDDATGVWTVTLPAAAVVANKTTTIAVTAISTASQEVTFTSTGYTGGGLAYSLNGGAQITITSGDKVSVKPGDVLVITGNGVMTVTETAAWSPTSTITPAAGNLSVTVTIPNITAGVGLTIADKT